MNIRLAEHDVDTFSATRGSGAATSFRVRFEQDCEKPSLEGFVNRTYDGSPLEECPPPATRKRCGIVGTTLDPNVERKDYYLWLPRSAAKPSGTISLARVFGASMAGHGPQPWPRCNTI